MRNYKLRPISFETATDKQLEAWYDLKIEHNREIHPDDPDMSLDYMLSRALALNNTQDSKAWVVWNRSGDISAYCRIHVSRSGFGKDRATFSILVRRGDRRRGIGTSLLEKVLEGAESFGRSKLQCFSKESCTAASHFLQGIGAERINTSSWSQLRIGDIHRETMEEWLKLPLGPGPRIRIARWEDHFPDESIQDVCDFYQAVHDHQQIQDGEEDNEVELTPEIIRSGDKWSLSGGRKRLLLYAEDMDDGRLIGLTEVLWNPSRSSIIKQGYTAVLPDARGRGIGRRLKAEMLMRIIAELPQARFIRTGNNDSRKAILKINNELGFRPYLTQFGWELDTDGLRGSLTDRG